MQATRALFQHSLRLTLFTHDHCSLCHSVKSVMSRVWDRRQFDYREIDILAPENGRWKKVYEMDIPVVHIDRTATLRTQHDETTASARKLKHRFTEEQLEKVMDEVEQL
ncbi:uncharacterized protein MYCFIDRAFT_28674 [Pseudocercospora fijiensis CIRAD86]|uniref:Glutaredoxin-like protein n=1 Tax=Pseudocercospora fijiensis (strain CIRAD86) TaxID=383855 RepID=N1Q5R3_PSEFD|nr:uncharacterized protein MYCFIDRAFT_28674 [Pseudocercospora fijiensis CIRAD86]EME87294.1 hypothetical protein MYCFIDRAFT_28674 [Pseudocercospora fijiensis CIRAD86]